MSKLNLSTGLAILAATALLSGCSTYPSKFKCQDARGLGCTMLSEINRQIDNGQIQELYQEAKPKCSGKQCGRKGQDGRQDERRDAGQLPQVRLEEFGRIYVNRQ